MNSRSVALDPRPMPNRRVSALAFAETRDARPRETRDADADDVTDDIAATRTPPRATIGARAFQ